ncbi:MAG: hypothetical protein MZW92_20215 [Comamonadaceae bacterium]|nr:hypothetical protein [Comamonadaceae bacterium]
MDHSTRTAIAYDQQERRHVPVDDQRPQPHRRPGARGPQGPAHDREALRADQDRARDRPGVPEERGRASRRCSPCTSSRCWSRRSSSASCARPCSAEASSELPLYPEQRQCRRPTTEQILRLFSLAERHHLLQDGAAPSRSSTLELTDLQRQVLGLLGVPEEAFRPSE